MGDRGFILDIFHPPSKPVLYIVGRLVEGGTFAIIEKRLKPGFYIRQGASLEEKIRQRTVKSPYRTMDGEEVSRLSFNTVNELKQARRFLEAEGVRTYEGDLKYADQYLLDTGISRAIEIDGVYSKGHRVDRVYINPQVTSSDIIPSLSIISLDIETSLDLKNIRAISMADDCDSFKKVLLYSPSTRKKPSTDTIEYCADEKELLLRFAAIIREQEPDILTGWNVIDFDFMVIAKRFKELGLQMDFGRSDMPATFLPSSEGQKNRILVPGRQVIDAMWLIRSSPDRYSDYSLETVSRTLLEEGKEISEKGAAKAEALEKLYREDPAAYGLYCLKDSELVIKILKKTGLMDLTIQRSHLTGIDPERAWTSILPFEHLYMKALHQRNMVAPTLGTDTLPVHGAAGGFVFVPQPGLYRNIYIFDFKSLYPSIIRTFNIDPVSFIEVDPEEGESEYSRRYIKAPNNACFSREPGILPEILSRFFTGREEAKKRGDHIASYVYKIIMNSFYGVLGTPGCRFASSLFAGAITGFGQMLLLWCRDYLAGQGIKVIYGDTDSLFVESGFPPDSPFEPVAHRGAELAKEINRVLKEYIKSHYKLESKLELEFEKTYEKLFIPPIRMQGEQKEEDSRGRSKGYAGFILSRNKQSVEELIEIKGMEAVRSDWTDLAHNFQKQLLALIFTEKGEKALKDYITGVISALKQGKLDRELIYRKTLRRPVSSYTKTKPPQVKAAEMMGWDNRRGKIEYFITQSGPEPVSMIMSPLDYNHYIEKQLKPIAYSFRLILPFPLEPLFDETGQQLLF